MASPLQSDHSAHGGDTAAHGGGKVAHRWSREVSEVDFHVDHDGAKATVTWPSRSGMVIKKGATLLADPPLLKDGSLGFSAKFGLQLREMNKDKISGNKTTADITVKSVNEVGHLLYFAGTNSWLVLKDAHGKTIDSYAAY
ncbi:MAG: hypothetical protein LBB58_04275 [Cellulomonadaceae bacterium]|jgi:hypothetical protein|nr:hypothetical protein [Cellulomonadaceae bacterium]